MTNYYRNQKVIKRWIKLLKTILNKQHLGLYEQIEKDYKMNRLIEVIDEYDDIIFEVNK